MAAKVPSGGIFCTPQQYVAVLTDAAIVPGVGDAVRELMKTQWIDWNDRVQVGKRGRCAFQRALTVSQQLLEATREFCWFRPPPHLQEVRDHATGVTRQHAELLVALLGALTAPAADYLIAAAAAERGFGVLHLDAHYDTLATVLGFVSVRLDRG